LATRFPEKAGRLRVDLSEVDRALAIDVDAQFLRQAIANILKNAVEAYDGREAEDVRVTVSARAVADEASVEIVIRDYGCGMQEPSAERAFVPFESSKDGGTGFGLFIARRVARNVHGGDLRLESVIGEGTTVRMTLPLRQEVVKGKRATGRRHPNR
jgi:signal transduction histidine kinase